MVISPKYRKVLIDQVNRTVDQKTSLSTQDSATVGERKLAKAPSYNKKERGWLTKHDHGGLQLQPNGFGQGNKDCLSLLLIWRWKGRRG